MGSLRAGGLHAVKVPPSPSSHVMIVEGERGWGGGRCVEHDEPVCVPWLMHVHETLGATLLPLVWWRGIAGWQAYHLNRAVLALSGGSHKRRQHQQLGSPYDSFGVRAAELVGPGL